jgi:hypothetical protein
LHVSAKLVGGATRVDTVLTVTNIGPQPLRDLRALVCLSGGGLDFPESGHEHTWVEVGGRLGPLSEVPAEVGEPLYQEPSEFSSPLTELESSDRDWVMGVAFEDDGVVGGNGGSGGVCIHSGPRFGTLEPGQTATRTGTIHIRRGRAADLFGREPKPPPRRCASR